MISAFSIKNIERTILRISRWFQGLEGFILKILFFPGVINIATDCLSRLPISDKGGEKDYAEEFVVTSITDGLTLNEWKVKYVIRSGITQSQKVGN